MCTVFIFLVLSWQLGCSVKVDDDLLATVGSKEIRINDLRQFQEKTKTSFRANKEGIDALQHYLQTIVDMELLLIEARERQLDQDSGFKTKWANERHKKLIDAYVAQTIVKQVDLKIGAIQQRFETSKWRRMLKFAHIRLENNAAAQKAMRDLEQGHPFDQVAKEHSLEPTTAARGGVLDHYYGRGNLKDLGMSTEIAEILFELEVGQFSQPILWGDYYEIFKILDEAPAPDHYKVSFVRGEYWEEFQNAWQTLVAELKQRFDVRLDQETIAFLVNRMSTSANRGVMLSPEEQEMVLCRFKGGQLTLKDFAGTYNSLWFFRSVYFDSSGITDFIHRDILPRAMVYHAALQENVDKEPTVATWLANKKEALLLETLRTKDVVEQVRIDSAMVRDYYDSHLNLFMQFEEFDMVEILVKTRQQAEALVQQIKDGQDLETLAAQYSIRQDSTGGRFHMHNHASERRVYGHLYDAVLAAEIGELTGPIAMDEGYSIFKVLKKIDRQPASFEVSASRATWWLKKQEERRLFDALFVRLREKHASSTVMYEDRLEKLLID